LFAFTLMAFFLPEQFKQNLPEKRAELVSFKLFSAVVCRSGGDHHFIKSTESSIVVGGNQ